MKKVLLSMAGMFLFLAFTFDVNAQVLNGVYLAHTTSERKPIPYQYLREADVMWSKVVWRTIDLTEKMNLPLYYPTEDIEGRKSLIQLILWGVKNKSLTAFSSHDFSGQRTLAEIEETFGASVDTITDFDDDGNPIQTIIKKQPDNSEVKQFLLKEMWFFDKQRSVMEVRTIGLCPIRVYYRDDDLEQTDMKRSKLFWIYYPEARNIFANQPVYNPDNQAGDRTYDDIFFKRQFSSFIHQESNVYNNRLINEYTTGLQVLLESEKIKEEIFNFEHDMWEF